MKIVVTIIESIEGDKHKIEVLDGSNVVCTKITDNIDQRDREIWNLADLYDTVEISIRDRKDKQKDSEFRYSEIPSIPVLDEEEAAEFFEDNTLFAYKRILKAIEEGVHTDLKEIRLFELSGSGEYLTATRETWRDGLDVIMAYFISVDEFELCIRGKKLIKKLS